MMFRDYTTLIETQNFISFWIKVTTRASSDELLWEHQFPIKIRVKALPVEGKANELLVKLIAKKMRIARTKVIIVLGKRSKYKKICVSKMDKRMLIDSLDAS